MIDLSEYRLTTVHGGALMSHTPLGSYPLVYVSRDSHEYCAKCATKIVDDPDLDTSEAWNDIVAVGTHWEGEPIVCDDCGEEIASAYGPVAGDS